MISKRLINIVICVCLMLTMFGGITISPAKTHAANIDAYTNQYTYIRLAPYWTSEVVDTIGNGVAIRIYWREYEYLYVQYKKDGINKRGYIPRANTDATGYSWCNYPYYYPGKSISTTPIEVRHAHVDTYPIQDTLPADTGIDETKPLLILHASGDYYYVQYLTNPTATGSTNPKFRRGWVLKSKVEPNPPTAPNIPAIRDNTVTYALIRHGASSSTSATYLTAVADSSAASGYKLSFQSGTGNTNQQWKIHKLSSTTGVYYKIQSVSSGLYVEIDGRIPIIASKFGLAAYGDPQKAQEFVIEYRNYNLVNGYMSSIRTRCSGDYLVAKKSGTDLLQYRQDYDDDNQIFFIDPINKYYENEYASGQTALGYYIDPSELIGGNITADRIEQSASAWNSISNVSLTRTTVESNAKIIVDGNNNYSGRSYGYFSPRITSSGDSSSTEAAMNSMWFSGNIRINTNSVSDYFMGNKSANDVKKVVTHEFGHSIKLRHPHEDDTGKTYRYISSVMNQGLPSNYTLCSSVPTAYDIRTLKNKWD